MSDNAEPARIGLVDDHVRFRRALRDVVDAMPDVTVAWEARDGRQALDTLATDPVDVLVVDLSLPGMNGIELIRRVVSTWPTIAPVVVSGHTAQSRIDESFQVGAHAYVLKGQPSELREGIRTALCGGRYLSPALHRPRPHGAG